ncbi:UNVERIFIED_ORG: invasion protein IalB [Rhizobium pisi]
MGFRSLAQSLVVTVSIAAAAATPVLAQQPAPATPAPAAPAPAAPQQPNAASPKAASPNVEPVTPGQTQPQAPGTVKSNHGAWSVVCDKPAGASTEQCALMQNVIAEDRPEVGLSVVVLKTADRKSKILRVLAPLGVLLPNGLGLNVDGKDIGRAYFVRCFADGCYAEVVLEDELLKTFRSGAQATFIVFQTPEEGIGIPVDLKGFAEGFDALP